MERELSYPPIHAAARQGSLEDLERESSYPPIHAAARQGSLELEDLERESSYSYPPIHAAARQGSLEDLRRLIDENPQDINKGTFDNVRPLHEACLAGNFDCAALLIESGANVNLQNLDGATALCDASFYGNLELVKLLLDNGALVNPPLLMSTPLHEAVLRGHHEIVSLLVEHGADLNKSDCHFGTPLLVAAMRGETKCAEILLRHGASPTQSKIHQTPLHEAADNQNLDLVSLLLKHGADVYARTSKGLTAKQLVRRPSCACKLALQHWESQPQPLVHHCRLTIRSTVTSPGSVAVMNSLGLPTPLARYLAFDPWPH